jgi:antitoxin VapB
MEIEDPQVERLLRRLAAETGETPKEALLRALEERLAKCRRAPSRARDSAHVFEAIMEISRRCSALPDLDQRTADEILAYNTAGAPE